MLSKEQRQRLIQDIINREDVSTQSELVDKLRADGVNVTQATVSRDINEMRLVRLPIGKGRHKYGIANVEAEVNFDEEISRTLKHFVYNIDIGENIIVIETAQGHASGVALMFDKWRRDNIVGTLAGEDTVLIIMRSKNDADAMIEELHKLME